MIFAMSHIYEMLVVALTLGGTSALLLALHHVGGISLSSILFEDQPRLRKSKEARPVPAGKSVEDSIERFQAVLEILAKQSTATNAPVEKKAFAAGSFEIGSHDERLVHLHHLAKPEMDFWSHTRRWPSTDKTDLLGIIDVLALNNLWEQELGRVKAVDVKSWTKAGREKAAAVPHPEDLQLRRKGTIHPRRTARADKEPLN